MLSPLQGRDHRHRRGGSVHGLVWPGVSSGIVMGAVPGLCGVMHGPGPTFNGMGLICFKWLPARCSTAHSCTASSLSASSETDQIWLCCTHTTLTPLVSSFWCSLHATLLSQNQVDTHLISALLCSAQQQHTMAASCQSDFATRPLSFSVLCSVARLLDAQTEL